MLGHPSSSATGASLQSATVRDVSVVSLDGSKVLSVESGKRIKLRIFVVLSGPIDQMQVFLGIRGHSRGLRMDFNAEGTASSTLLASANQLIFDGTEKGTGGVLHGGTHGFDVLINTDELRAEGIHELPPSFRVEDDGLIVYVKYLIKVLVTWPGPLQTRLKKDAIAELKIKAHPSRIAKALIAPHPYVHSVDSAPSLSREDFMRQRRIAQSGHEIEWNFSFSRQAVVPGDTLKCMMVYRTSILSQLDQIRVSILQRTKYRSDVYGHMEYTNGTKVIEKIKDLPNEDPGRQKRVDFMLTVPMDISPTMRLGTMSHDLYICMEVKMKGKPKILRLMEAPLHVASEAPPRYSRKDSKDRELVYAIQKEAVENLDEPQTSYMTTYAFNPEKDDEIFLSLGDKVEIRKSFEDGWSFVVNHSQHTSGLVPSYCMTLPSECLKLPDLQELSAAARDIIVDLRRLCKFEERYDLHLNTLTRSHVGDGLVKAPELAYLLRPKSRITRILRPDVDDCPSCLSHQGVI